MKQCNTCRRRYEPISKSTQKYYCSWPCYLVSKKKAKIGYRFSWGYKYIYMPNHPFANDKKYVAEHRLVIEKVIGRYLRSDEIVHHINKDKLDNHPENLEVHTRRDHAILHRRSSKSPTFNRETIREK